MTESNGRVPIGNEQDSDGWEMISSIEIKGYRGFRDFKMSGLGRINLLVGKNNSGKTTVLEALNMLATNGDPYALWRLLTRRGERVMTDAGSTNSGSASEAYIQHLFHGHGELAPTSKFTVAAKTNLQPMSLTCRISELITRDSEGKPLPPDPEKGVSYGLVLETPTKKAPSSFIALTRRGTITYTAVDTASRRGSSVIVPEATRTQFVGTESLEYEQLAVMWNDIALTDGESRVISALQFIDPQIEAIAPVVTSGRYTQFSRGGFRIRKRGQQPIPIGTLGDGTWRILSLVIALSQTKGGMLLIDEIDTGLHYSVMTDLWKLIYDTAKLLDVQVFATTHSRDCVESLASICSPEHAAGEISVQRIDASKSSAVAYTESEIMQAARHHIEVR